MKLLALAPVLALAACADNGPSKQEAARIYQAMSVAATNGRVQAVNHAGAPLTAPADLTLDYSGPCSLGGTVGVQGTFSGDETTATGSYDLTAAFAACHEAPGTLDGSIHWSGSSSATGFSSSMVGNIDFDDGSTTTSCAIDVQMTVGATGVTSTGTFCGYDVSQLSAMP